MRNLAESIRFSADIVRVISDYVSLKGSGTNLKGLCPFHSEKTPSFSVHGEKQIFHCFGCGVGGDVFKFVMLAEKVTFPESIRIVAEKCGLPIPTMSKSEDREARTRQSLLEIYDQAAQYFRRRLGAPDAAGARQVLERRQIRPEFEERFCLGYAPTSGLLEALTPSQPMGTGLFAKNDRGEIYDRFRRRLMFPIWNERGRVIAFGGRIIGEGQPKYLNSPESPLYSKSFVLYGLHLAKKEARRTGRMVIVEGYFDCLSLHQNGVENVVASCGTSLTAQQVAVLARSVSEVVVNYDPDAAGQSAARRSVELLLERGLTVRILRLPGGLDPDEFVRRKGGAAYQQLLARAPYFWEHLIEVARSEADLGRPEVKSRLLGEILGYVRHINDRVIQLEIVRAVSESFRLPENVVLAELRTSRRPTSRPEGGTTLDSKKLLPAEKQIIQAILQDPDSAVSLAQFLQSEGGEFLDQTWAGSILRALILNPQSDIEKVLEAVNDSALEREVRATALEPVGSISADVAMVSMGRLYQDYLLRQERELREELKRYGSAPAPKELVHRQMEIASEKSRLRALRAQTS